MREGNTLSGKVTIIFFVGMLSFLIAASNVGCNNALSVHIVKSESRIAPNNILFNQARARLVAAAIIRL